MAEQALMHLGQMGEYLKGQEKNDGTTLQRNYEFLKGQNPQLADQYLRNGGLPAHREQRRWDIHHHPARNGGRPESCSRSLSAATSGLCD
jgi:hypothetical protein